MLTTNFVFQACAKFCAAPITVVPSTSPWKFNGQSLKQNYFLKLPIYFPFLFFATQIAYSFKVSAFRYQKWVSILASTGLHLLLSWFFLQDLFLQQPSNGRGDRNQITWLISIVLQKFYVPALKFVLPVIFSLIIYF